METVQVVQSKQNLEDGQIKHHVRVWVWCVVGGVWRGVRWRGVCVWGGGGCVVA